MGNGNQNKNDKNDHSLQEKMQDKFEDVYHFAQTNTWDTVAYVVLFIGLLFALFGHSLLGGLIIGIIGGLYFADAIVFRLKHVQEDVKAEGIIRSLIMGGVAIGLFILAPGIFIGGAIAIGIKQIVNARRE